MASQNVDITFRLRDRASQGLRNIRQNLRSTRDTMASAGRTAGIFAAALGGIIFAAARAGATQRRAIAGLRAGINALGEDVDTLVPKVEAATAALQRKTNFGDEEQIRALTRMLPIFGSVEKALEALPVVLDAATLSETDLATAAENVARVIDSGEGRILRVIDATRKARIIAAPPAERLGLLAGAFKGQAEAAATGTIQFKNALGDLLESLQIDVALDNIGTGILKLADGFDALDPDHMRKVGEALLFIFVVVSVGALAAGIAVIAAITATGAIILGVAIAIGLLGAGIIIFGEDILKAFDDAQIKVDAFTAGLPDFIRIPVEVLTGDIVKLMPFLSEFRSLLEFIGDPNQWRIDFLATEQAKLKVWRDFFENAKNATINFVMGTIPDFLSLVAGWIRDHANMVIDWIDGIIPEWLKRVWTWTVDHVGMTFDFVKGFIPDWLKTILEWSTVGIAIKVFATLFGLGGNFLGRGGGGSSDRHRDQREGESHSDFHARGGVHMAAGGIVRGPTLALIGERGPEAVIPLTGPNAGGIGGVTVNVILPTNGLVILDNEASARRLASALMPLIRTELRTQQAFS